MAAKNPKWNVRSGSHTWSHEPDKISRPRRRTASTAGGTPSFHGVRRRDWREPLTIQVQVRGGGEAWVLVNARGRRQAFTGITSLLDVVAIVNGTYNDPDAEN